MISQGGVVPFINPEVSQRIVYASGPFVDGFLAAPAQQNAKGQEGESGGLDTVSLYHYCTTIRTPYPILLVLSSLLCSLGLLSLVDRMRMTLLAVTSGASGKLSRLGNPQLSA